MNPRLAAVMRLLKRLVSLLAVVVLFVVLAASVTAYLAVSGTSLPVLRALTARVGTLMAGQRTEQLTLDVRVRPRDGRIAGTATLTVRSLDDNRQRFYFLLNNGLRIRDVRTAGEQHPHPSAYQLSLLTVVDVGAPVAKGATIDLTIDYDGAPGAGLWSVAAGGLSPQHVLLNVDEFWFPTDVQSFFNADVTVTLPANLTVVHNGMHPTSILRGDLQQVHWTTARPVAGLALIAGPYTLASKDINGTTYRVYLASDIQLDTARILKAMSAATTIFEERFGASGYPQITLFVSREFRRGFNDGSGLMGLSVRYFRTGDYGFAIVAHEIAHNWWGGTVAEKWLTPGSGGEWIVEGFAEFSSLVAAEATFGQEALTRRLAGEFFDPARQAAIADMSVLDNALAEATARDTIYRKGAYVAMMLRRTLGDEACFRGLRQFLEHFKYQQVSDRDLQTVLQEASGQNLDSFFADWVRSNSLLDLSLDANGQGELTVSNLGTAAAPADIELWTFKKTGGEAIRRTVHVGDKLPPDTDAAYSVLDPLLTWADTQRENNRYPRRNDPVSVAISSHGDMLLTAGEPFPWVRTTITSVATAGTQHTWDFERGVLDAPSWSADGGRAAISYAPAKAAVGEIIVLSADGTRRTVGHGTSAAAASDGSIYIAREDRIARVGPSGSESTLVQQRGEILDTPLPSPDGTQLVYTATRGNHLELRIVSADGRNRVLVSSDRDRLLYRWSPDGARLYTVIGGNWDWQIWEVPLGAEALRPLAKGAAAISDLAVSSDGSQLAFTAAPALDYPMNRRQLFIVNLQNQSVRTIDVPDADLTSLAWSDADSLLTVAAVTPSGEPWIFPAPRTLKRVRLSDGHVDDVR